MAEHAVWVRGTGGSIPLIPTIMDTLSLLRECSDLVDELDAALTSAEEAVTVEDLKELEARVVALKSRA